MKFSLVPLTSSLRLATFMVFAFTGCQTTKGSGNDVELLGEKFQGKAR